MTKYLYNGIELPALPELPKDLNGNTMTYVAIEVKSNDYYIHFSGQPITFGGTKFVVNLPRAYGYIVNDEWLTDLALGGYYTFYNCLWSNHDIINADGSVYLPASDPVPVLSWSDKTPYRRMNNQWVKQDTYKRVNGEWVKQDEYRRES